MVVEFCDEDFSAGLSFVTISQVETLKDLAFCSCIDHTQLKKPKETDSMLMLKKYNECYNQLGFRLNTYGMDFSEYTFTD